MIVSLRVELAAVNPLMLKGYGGEAVHKLFHDVMTSHSAKLGSYFREMESNNSEPFALSGVLEQSQSTPSKRLFKPGETLSFRISVLDERLIPDVLAAFGKAVNLNEEVPVSNGRVIFRKLSYRESESPWVRTTLYAKLLEGASHSGVVRLKFITPASFRARGKRVILPDASHIFGSLIKRWNSFSKIKIEENLLEKLSSLDPFRFDLKSERVSLSNSRIIGFKGTLEFRLGRNFTRQEKRAVSALSSYAFYAGVGIKTTMGMGQTIKID